MKVVPLRNRFMSGGVSVVLCLAIAGCTSSDAGISAVTSTALQARVRTIAQLVAEHKDGSALSDLAGLQSQVTAAVATGQITSTRAVRIQTAIRELKTDLTALTPPASPSPAPTITVTAAPTATAQTGTGNNTPSTGKGKSRGHEHGDGGGG